MTTRIIIARHGNTLQRRNAAARRRTDGFGFGRGRARTERGALSESQRSDSGVGFAAPLKRTVNTAKLAIEEMGGGMPLEIDDSFAKLITDRTKIKPTTKSCCVWGRFMRSKKAKIRQR